METFLSELRYQIPDKQELHQASITAVRVFRSFGDCREHILERLRYPEPQTGKYNCYGYVPALYARKLRVSRAGNEYMARWRCAESEDKDIYLFYADIDNHDPLLPRQQIDDVCDRIEMMGFSYFLHSTYSHTPEHHRMRLVVELDRVITRDEMLRIFVWLNWEAFGSQGDASIYSPGDYVYAPPFQCETRFLDGRPLDVDAALADEAVLREEHPEIWAHAEMATRTREPRRPISDEDKAKLAGQKADTSVRHLWITIKNPEVFNPDWSADYINRDRPGVGGSHWKAMRSILGSVWRKNKGALTWGEMAKLFDEIDALDGNYFTKKYSAERADEIIEFVMSQPCPDDDDDPDPNEGSTIVDEPGPEDNSEIKENTEIINDLGVASEWNFLADPCGAGKSWLLREVILNNPQQRHWLYAVDKIDRIDEVIGDFNGHHWRAGGYEVHDAFSTKLNDDGEMQTVIGQLAGIRHKIDRRENPSITFITHAALLMYPWNEWEDHALICDEKPPIWYCDIMNDVSQNFNIIERYFEIDQREGDRIRLRLTDAGRHVAGKKAVDVFDKRIWPLLSLADRGRHVWINQEGWDSRGDGIEFYALTLPDQFADFKQRWMAGDNLDKSLLYRLWEGKGVAWSHVRLPGARQRSTPLSERGKVVYFMGDGASFNRFKQPDRPLLQAAAYVAEKHAEEQVLYTVNQRGFTKRVHDVFSEHAVYVTPKQTGTERYADIAISFWGAAIQASQDESELIRKLTGMTRREIDLDREFDAMNQFMFRTISRDYDSDAPFVYYVMSKAQADYFAERYQLPIERANHADGSPIVVDKPKGDVGGRPKKIGWHSMSVEDKRAYKAEKQRKRRAKM